MEGARRGYRGKGGMEGFGIIRVWMRESLVRFRERGEKGWRELGRGQRMWRSEGGDKVSLDWLRKGTGKSYLESGRERGEGGIRKSFFCRDREGLRRKEEKRSGGLGEEGARENLDEGGEG